MLGRTGIKLREINRMKDIQKKEADSKKDDYMIGMYNGLELASAILENREPVFLDCVIKEPEVIDKTENIGRTKYSGVIRR